MKLLLFILAILGAGAAAATESTAAPNVMEVNGEVLEVTNVDNYTYLRLKTKDGETWAAVSKAPLIVGDRVTIEDAAVMESFESKTLQKTFDTIIFGVLGNVAGTIAASAGVAETANVGVVNVQKAQGPDAYTVAEIVTNRANLKDKAVLVRGMVVKYNKAVMGKNWIHLRDGSGSDADGSNDVLVTSTDQAKIGEVVILRGVVHTDKDFGAGYSYKVLIEDATLNK